MPNEVSILVTADGTQATKALKEVGATATQTAKANTEAAKATAMASKFAGDAVTEQSLRIIKAREEERLVAKDFAKMQALMRQGYIGEAEGATATAAAYQRLTAAKLQTASASEIQSVATHATISDMQATSAAIRTFEGNPGIRAVERFVTTIPGVGAALRTIFPLVGAAAFAGIAVDMFEKFEAFIAKAKEAPEAIRAAYAELNTAAETTNDEMRLTNTNLENEIAKLAGKPENNLKVALYESWIEADKLSKMLSEDLSKSEKLFKENTVGSFVGHLTGQDSTKLVEGSVVSFQKQISQAADANNVAVHGGDPAAIKAAKAKLDGLNQSFDAWMKNEEGIRSGRIKVNEYGLAGQTYSVNHGDQTSNLAILRGVMSSRLNEGDAATLGAQNTTDKAALATAKGSAGVQKKADEARLKAMEASLRQQELLGDVSVKYQFDYWETMKSTFKTGSSEYNTIVEKQVTLAVEGAKTAHQTIARSQELMLRLDAMPMPKGDGLLGWKRQDARVRESGYDTSNEMYAIQQKIQSQLEVGRIHQQAGRQISEEAAAILLAANNAKEYSAELERLNLLKKEIETNSLLSNGEDDQQRKVDELKKKIAELEGRRQVQDQQDAFGIQNADTSAVNGAVEALQEFARSATDASAGMKNFLTNGFSQVNGGLVKMLTESGYKHRGQWGGIGHSIATNATGSLLKGAEGMLLKGIKADGSTASNAFWVRMATAVGNDASKVASTVAKATGGGMKWLGTALQLAGFADGGDFSGNSPFWVGENGPEIVMPKSAGTVIPNGKSMGGDQHTWNIDARGSNDPAQVHAAIMAAAPHIAAAAVARVQQNRLRSSGMGGR